MSDSWRQRPAHHSDTIDKRKALCPKHSQKGLHFAPQRIVMPVNCDVRNGYMVKVALLLITVPAILVASKEYTPKFVNDAFGITSGLLFAPGRLVLLSVHW